MKINSAKAWITGLRKYAATCSSITRLVARVLFRMQLMLFHRSDGLELLQLPRAANMHQSILVTQSSAVTHSSIQLSHQRSKLSQRTMSRSQSHKAKKRSPRRMVKEEANLVKALVEIEVMSVNSQLLIQVNLRIQFTI